MVTNCQEMTGSVSDFPVKAWVNKTFMEGLNDKTMSLEMVANAMIT